VFRLASDFCATTLSALYLDSIKDRLYVEKAESHKRRSAQTVCFVTLDVLCKLIAPIMSFTSEKIHTLYQPQEGSIHLADLPLLKDILSFFASRYPKVASVLPEKDIVHQHVVKDMMTLFPAILQSFAEYQDLSFLKTIRSAILKKIEEQREKGIIKHSLEARILLCITRDSMREDQKKYFSLFTSLCGTKEAQEMFFKEFLIVSECNIHSHNAGLKNEDSENGHLEVTDIQGIYVAVAHATGVKCPRCWHWTNTTQQEGLCNRCVTILESR
jgi:isoleucyl-tRNA synthetase